MKNYLFLVALASSLIIGLCGAANYFLDPFLIYRLQEAGSAELGRVEQFPNMRLYKPLHVNRIKPEALIIGSSRTGGIRPANPEWADYRRYNFSTPGMTIYEIKRSVEHAQAVTPLQKLMIGLDYSAIILPTPLYRIGFQESRLANSAEDLASLSYLKQKLVDFQSTLFTLDVLEESFKALTQRQKKIRQYFPDGAWRGTTTRLTGRGGYLYVAKTALEENKGAKYSAKNNLKILHDLLEFCYQHKIDTKLFLTPTHVFFVDLWQTQATTKLWREVHLQIVTINDNLAKEYDRHPFEIWGFGQAKGIVDEPIYPSRETPKAWFNDGVHFRPKLSRRIMKSLWGLPSNFGQQLSVTTITTYLDEIDSVKQEFLRANQKQVSSLHEKLLQK